MTLPLSRDVSFAPGTQIPSTFLNNLQDMIIGGRHGPVTKSIFGNANAHVEDDAVNTFWSTVNVASKSHFISRQFTTNIGLDFYTDIPVGATLRSYQAWVDDASAGAGVTIQSDVVVDVNNGAASLNPGGFAQDASLDVGNDILTSSGVKLMVTGERVAIRVTARAIAQIIEGVEITYDF